MSDCGVCIGGYDGEQAEFYCSQMVKARKPHKCYECHGTINPSEKYERVSGKWDGEIDTYYFCAICSELSLAFACDGRLFGTLWEDITEYLFPEMTTGCLEKLTTAAAKAELLRRWNEWKF